jgi:2-dehydro-3-deoxyphosphooctonate aldolase (KDO 8-P synthase)
MKLFTYTIDNDAPFFLMAGPCVIESELIVMRIAEQMAEITQRLGIPYVFKASFDKANRSSHESFRGPGMALGLEILNKVKQQFRIPVVTDVHEETALDEVASVVDVLQTPAFLCRQTNFIQKVARCGIPVNIKKGQFLAPWDMQRVIEKAHAVGNHQVMACERGACFGYNNLVSDMRSLAVMKGFNVPVVFDATHSVQLPGGLGNTTGGQREFIPVLAKAAVSVGIAGIFMETHPDPDNALSDGPNSWHLDKMEPLLKQLLAIDRVVKETATELV